MKRAGTAKPLILSLMVSLLLLHAAVGSAEQQPYRIPLDPSMVMNEVDVGDAGMLVDEQGYAEGFTEFIYDQPPTHTPSTEWEIPWQNQDWYWPASAVIDPGRE